MATNVNELAVVDDRPTKRAKTEEPELDLINSLFDTSTDET
jgi:hypothetical protein